MADEEIIQAVESALGQAPTSVVRLAGGANNIVAKVEVAGQALLAKVYFTHARDTRDRLGTEFGVLTFLRENGIHCVPKPIAMNRDHRVGIYEFIPGDRPEAGDIRWDDVRQLTDLLGAMWNVRSRPGADKLPNASEACFSLGAYRDHVRDRLDRVESALTEDRSAVPAREFVRSQIRPAFEQLSEFAARRANEYRLDLQAELPVNLRTLSPADHGFHNTLRADSGRLVFVDFEYAGWDQPAQVLANACLQPEIPMPPDLCQPFLKDMLRRLETDPRLVFRLRLLYPLLSLKWSLIMLNEFLPVAGQRRSLAGSNSEARRTAQLEKSKIQLKAAATAAADGFFLDDLIDERDTQTLRS